MIPEQIFIVWQVAVHLPAASFYSELLYKLGNSVLKSKLSTTAGKTQVSLSSIDSFSIKMRNWALQMRFNILEFQELY